MKILLLTRATLFEVRGGDTVQVEKTAKYLRKMGVDVDIRLSTELIDYSPYDLVHFFNIIRPADLLCHARVCGKPFLISTIYVDYDEYDRKVRGGVIGRLRKIFTEDGLEYLKVIARFIRNGEKIASWQYLLKGHKNSIKELIQKATLLLPNSESEMKRLEAQYGFGKADSYRPYRVIPNGIDPDLLDLKTEHVAEREDVLCVAQIEGRKNQLNLIKAMKGLPWRLSIIGKNPPNFEWYMKTCRQEADSYRGPGARVQFIPWMPQEELTAYYRSHKVHVLPSWFETTGLSSLEAAAMGCNIVISPNGDTREYFGDDAFYCDPADVNSIREAIIKAYDAAPPAMLAEKIKNEFSWEKAAEKTLAAYHEALRLTT